MKPQVEQELSHTLLLELLAYQFASPVRWIETQDFFLTNPPLERLVEIGPSPTLTGMAMKTLQFKYREYDAAKGIQRQLLCYAKNQNEIHYNSAQAVEQAVEPKLQAPVAVVSSDSTPAPVVAAAAPIVAAVKIDDKPVSVAEILFSVIAHKIKKPIDEIPISTTIKDIVGGKSTLQNEILGDLAKDFTTIPEKPEEIALDELAEMIQPSFSGVLGTYSSTLISKLVSAKMPGGFAQSKLRTYLDQTWGLRPGRQDSALILAVTLEPPSRLASENDVYIWLDTVVQKYASRSKILIQKAQIGSGAIQNQTSAISEAELKKITGNQTMLITEQLELFARFLHQDLRAGQKLYIAEKEITTALQSQLDLWLAEHGEFYASGIGSIFNPKKVRVYDSAWNWVRQDALSMYYDIIFGKLKLVDREIVAQCISIINRSNPILIEFMQYHIDHCPTDRGEAYALAKEYASRLLENCQEALNVDPHFKDVHHPTAPKTKISGRGEIVYSEVPRSECRKLELYVAQMAKGGEISQYVNKDRVQSDLTKLYKAIMTQRSKLSVHSKERIKLLYSEIARTIASESMTSNMEMSDIHVKAKRNKLKYKTIPFLHILQKTRTSWEYSKLHTDIYLQALEKGAREGITFANRYALMTGCGADSIGANVLQGLIAGGAKVVVTTSRFSKQTTEFYQSLYTRHGSKGSCLVVVPFNQGSQQDVKALVEYIYNETNGLGWDLDFVLPFAAIPEAGRAIDSIDSKSELAHRIMLTNLLRMLGEIKVQKEKRQIFTRPAQVILPLSPNHGTFGNDGLYSESKLALETLYNRWFSESWGQYLTICGTVIGWTRGTGLMNQNNFVAEGIEKFGVRTFSQKEMAFNILGLMTPAIVNLSQESPINANLNGGLEYLPNLKDLNTKLRNDITAVAQIRRAISAENSLTVSNVGGSAHASRFVTHKMTPRANLKFEFPKMKDQSDLKHLNHLRGLIDFENVVVVTGFSEVGPWGNSRTRWEMEANGEFSLEGCIEMAWIMGYIKHHNGPLKNGKNYSGWIDSKTGDPVDDFKIKNLYENDILKHSGIRLIESQLFNGYDPNKKELIQEVQISHDLEPFETSRDAAFEFKRYHGDNVEVFETKDSDEYSVRFKKGATILLPKALQFNRLVCGQIPTGWDPKRYGISEDIINQVDPATLYVLVSVAEAMVSSGITDPYEFYKYVHVSEVGNVIGSGIGGTFALRGMYKERWLDRPLQKDILQESFINTASAWVNMLLLSSSGPIKTPVGACATAIEAIDIAVDTIVAGKAKIIIAGGYDDFSEEGSYEFANMGATSNSVEEFARGRDPKEMSRPATTTRNGFMESQGAGICVLMQAKLAIEMGVPIHGMIVYSGMAMDKEGRSVPAPGKGLMTGARETKSKFPSPLLDLKYRSRQLENAMVKIKEWAEKEYLNLEDDLERVLSEDKFIEPSEYRSHRISHIELEFKRQISMIKAAFGTQFWRNDPSIAPIRGALAVWGLTIDDIGVASFHGTSTQANEKNECTVISAQLNHLGRSKGNPVFGVFQKHLTGHPKGGAAAWMLNGALQILDSGIVPGNRNADNIDEYFSKFDKIQFPSRSIRTDGIKAVSVSSFGFGQVGGQVIVVHPDYLFAALQQDQYEEYKQKRQKRYQSAYRYMHNSMVYNNMFKAKNAPPYTEDIEQQVYLEPTIRAKQESGSFSFSFSKKQLTPQPKVEALIKKLADEKLGSVGVDIEIIDSINIDNQTFIDKNFTMREQKYCNSSSNRKASFAGTWSAKEAVFKSLNVASQGAASSLKEIEIVHNADGVPMVELHGKASEAALSRNIGDFKLSISHDDFQSLAFAISLKQA